MKTVGVIGPIWGINKVDAWTLVKRAFNQKIHTKDPIHVISQLIDDGIPQATYYFAKQQGWTIGGIACSKAKEHIWFPMSAPGNTLKIVGNEWGEELEEFISHIDILISIDADMKVIKLANAKKIPIHKYSFKDLKKEKDHEERQKWKYIK